MENFNAEQKINLELNNLLQKIKYEIIKDGSAYFPIFTMDRGAVKYKESLRTLTLLDNLEKDNVIEINKRSNEEINITIEEDNNSGSKTYIVEGYFVKPIEPKFSEFCEKYSTLASEQVTIGKTEYKNEILYFLNKEINFNNKQNQKYLLTTLFKNPNKNWFYDEVQHDWDETDEDKLFSGDWWKRFYNAGCDINDEVEKKTQIDDFIIKNTKEIRINPKYL